VAGQQARELVAGQQAREQSVPGRLGSSPSLVAGRSWWLGSRRGS
jgi:hypothetical protein